MLPNLLCISWTCGGKHERLSPKENRKSQDFESLGEKPPGVLGGFLVLARSGLRAWSEGGCCGVRGIPIQVRFLTPQGYSQGRTSSDSYVLSTRAPVGVEALRQAQLLLATVPHRMLAVLADSSARLRCLPVFDSPRTSILIFSSHPPIG